MFRTILQPIVSSDLLQLNQTAGRNFAIIYTIKRVNTTVKTVLFTLSVLLVILSLFCCIIIKVALNVNDGSTLVT